MKDFSAAAQAALLTGETTCKYDAFVCHHLVQHEADFS